MFLSFYLCRGDTMAKLIFSDSSREEVKKPLEKDGLQLRYAYREVDDMSCGEAQNLANALNKEPKVYPPTYKPDLHLPRDFRNVRELALIAVKQNGLALDLVSPSLQKDDELVREAIAQNGDALLRANKTFWAQKDYVLLALQTGSMAHAIVDKALFTDKQVAIAMVKAHGQSLAQVAKYFEGDDLVELEQYAVAQNGLAFEHVRQNSKSDMVLAQTAIWQNPQAIEFADPSIQNSIPLRALFVIRSVSLLMQKHADIMLSVLTGLASATLTAVALAVAGVPTIVSISAGAFVGLLTSDHGLFNSQQDTDTQNCLGVDVAQSTESLNV